MSRTLALLLLTAIPAAAQEKDPDRENVREFQKKMNKLCEKVAAAYVFIGGGSGVVISADGWILTNHHVAGPSGREHTIHLTGGKEYKADVIGHDPTGDVSLLKIRDAKKLAYLDLGSSDALEIGQMVVAVGNPFGLGSKTWDPTITFGVISAIHRFQDWYMDAIHTDAHINPGNSGGPLITLEGKIIGINGRGGFARRRTRVSSGIGLAISSSQIRRYLPQLKVGGRVYHGMVDGITITEAGDEDYENVGAYGDGILVAGVDDDSRASEAGLQTGDVITHIGPYRTFNKNRFFGVTGAYPVGTKVKFRYRRRDGAGEWKPRETELVLGDPAKVLEGEMVFRALLFGFGPAYAQKGDGLKINSVVEKGPAEKAGLLPGDKIIEADGKKVTEYIHFVTALIKGEKKVGDTVALKVKRGGDTVEVELELRRNPNYKARPTGPPRPVPPKQP